MSDGTWYGRRGQKGLSKGQKEVVEGKVEAVEDKDDDEGVVARKVPGIAFAEVGRKWCCSNNMQERKAKLFPIRVGAKVPSVRLLTPSVVPASYISDIDQNGYRDRSGRLCQQARRRCHPSPCFPGR